MVGDIIHYTYIILEPTKEAGLRFASYYVQNEDYYKEMASGECSG